MCKHAQAMGRKGGPARAKALSKERRQEIARSGAEARWGKKVLDVNDKPKVDSTP